MAKLSTVTALAQQSVIVYGPPKTGKTEIVGKLAEKYKLIWFDLENGHQTLLKLPEEYKDRIELIALPDTRSYPIAIETCLKVVKGNPVDICEEHGKIMCPRCKAGAKPHAHVNMSALGTDTIVVFDSLTQLTNSAIAHITKGKDDDYKLQFDDWGLLGKVMDIFLSHIQQARCHVVVISHEAEAELEDGKTKLVPVAGSRNFSRNAAKYFGHVVYCQIANRKHTYTSSTTANTSIVAGSRTDVVTEKMDEPSLLPIFQLPHPKTPGEVAASKLSTILKK